MKIVSIILMIFTAFTVFADDAKSKAIKENEEKIALLDKTSQMIEALRLVKDGDTEKLKQCSEKGNPYCSGGLGLIYYERGLYSTAYPLLLKGSKTGYASIDFTLGEMFAKGNGVLQSEEKAIKYFYKAAKNGCSDSAYNISVFYSVKCQMLQNNYRPNAVAQFKYNAYRDYAWLKIAQALGQKEVIKNDGSKIPISKDIEMKRDILISRGWLSEADKLAIEICSDIPECIQ